MNLNRSAIILAISLMTSSAWAAQKSPILVCDLAEKVQGKLAKVELTEVEVGKSLRLYAVSQATANMFSEDSWDIWSMARVVPMTIQSFQWTGHTFPILAVAANASDSEFQSVEIFYDPSYGAKNATIVVNGLSYDAQCRR